jgi:Do/DeqQ family serine protease
MNKTSFLICVIISFIAGSVPYFIFTDSSKEAIYNNHSINAIPVSTNIESSPNSSISSDLTYASSVSTPSVVFISTTGSTQRNSWFELYFNGNSEQVISSGSGVIFSSDGYIVTNHHVIQRATKIEVIHQRNTYEAKLIGSDPSADLAVLKIEDKNLPAIKTTSSSSVQIGEWVLAVGNPFNLTSTVTAGIVSAKGRNINVVNSQFPIESFIQTDAAINPGNSGGALVNTKGELIGINTAILSRTGSYTGYGFAVPSDIVVKIVQDIIQYGAVQKAFFGADVMELNTNKVKELKAGDVNGVYIVQLLPDGAAQKSGLQLNDVVIQLNDKKISSKGDFDEYIAYHKPGDKLKVIFKRNGDIQETTLLLTNQEGTTAIIKKEVYISNTLNADFEVVPKVEKEKLNIENGVKMTHVRPGLMSRLGLQEGFIITHINRVPIQSASDIEDILTKVKGRVIIEGVQSNGSKMIYQYFF